MSQEPLSLLEARKQVGLGEDANYHDERLKDWIVAARRQVESDSGIVCYTGEHIWKITEWPNEMWLDIPVRPVTAIGSVTYVDFSGVTQAWSSSLYSLETSGVRSALRLGYLSVWPVSRLEINSVTVTLTAGYASVPVIPREIKVAVSIYLQYLWSLNMAENQGAESLLKAYDRLLSSSLLMRSTYP